MRKAFKLTPETAEAMCGYARQGLPAGRAAAMCGIHRVTAQRWLREGAIEISEAGDGDTALGPRAEFATSFEAARAAFLLGLATKWQECIDKQDYNTAKAIQVMLASQSPDEYSERRATRTVDQRVAMQADLTVNRFASMSADDLDAERQRIAGRIDAAQALGGDEDWRAAAVRLPRQEGDDDGPDPAVGKNNLLAENLHSGSQTRKTQSGALPAVRPASPENILPSRAQVSGASVADDQAEFVVAAGLTPDHTGGDEVATYAVASSPPLLPALAADDDDETKL